MSFFQFFLFFLMLLGRRDQLGVFFSQSLGVFFGRFERFFLFLEVCFQPFGFFFVLFGFDFLRRDGLYLAWHARVDGHRQFDARRNQFFAAPFAGRDRLELFAFFAFVFVGRLHAVQLVERRREDCGFLIEWTYGSEERTPPFSGYAAAFEGDISLFVAGVEKNADLVLVKGIGKLWPGTTNSSTGEAALAPAGTSSSAVAATSAAAQR